MKIFVIILFCFSGLGIYSQNQIKQPVLKNTSVQDSTKKALLKNKNILKKLDTLSKIDIEIVFDNLKSKQDSVSEKLKPFKTNAATSYYADKFQGRKTASGQLFDNKKFTAAHKTLPFGTKIKITNEANGKSVVVTVNDRGPFTKGRELDLSKAAFLEITRDIKHGTMRVTIEILE